MATWPFFFGYLGFEACRKAVRGCRGVADEGRLFTSAAHATLDRVYAWNWTPVLRFAAIWGIGLVALSVVISKFTVLLMSIVVSASKDASMGVATAIIVGTGMTLFLLPPVPGAPIYLAAGVLLVANGKANGFSVVSSIGYACVVSLVTKLCACVLQQKVIGGNLAGKVWIRQLRGAGVARQTRRGDARPRDPRSSRRRAGAPRTEVFAGAR